MTLESRNARAMASGQAAWDNASPVEDDGREDYIKEQVDEIMATGECAHVPFFTKYDKLRWIHGFDVPGSEAICGADTNDCELLQIVMACLNGDHEKAASLAKHFEQPLRDAAERMVIHAMGKDFEK